MAPSPLTSFLYLLMRDHLPSGQVKRMIEQAQAADSLTAPELQALAERYANDLQPPRSAADPVAHHADVRDAPPPAANPARTKVIDALGGSAGWLSIGELMRTTGLARQTVQKHVQQLVGTGEVEAKGKTRSRRYRLDREHISDHTSEQTSGGEHDDGEEGVKPDDPPGDAGVQEGGPGSPGARPSTPVGTAARPEETDVELMARVGDYIKEAEAEVYPTEIDSVFALDRGRRQRIIGMLLERHRVVKVGGGPRTAYISREKEGTDFSINGGSTDDETMGRPLHLKDPEKGKHSRAPKITDELVASFKTWARGQRTFKRRHVIDAFPDLSISTIARLCARMAGEGFLENRGSGGGAHYAVKDVAAPEDSLGRRLDGADEGTLEGRVMAVLDGEGGTLATVVTKVGAPEEEVKRVIAKLIHEDNVRVASSNGSVHYVAT